MTYKVRDADGTIIFFETSSGDGTVGNPFKMAAAASLPLPSGAATSAAQTDGTQKSIARGGAKGTTTAADVTSSAIDANTQALDVAVKNTVPVSGAFYQATQPVSFTWSGLTDAQLRATAVPVSIASIPSHAVTNAGTFAVQATGTVTANLGTIAGVATETTLAAANAKLTDGTQKSIARGGAKGTTTAADVTSSAIDANTQALDVAVKNTVPVSGAFYQATQPVSFTWSGLTDAQLRATAVPVSIASIPSHAVTNAGTFAVQATGTVTANLGTIAGAATETTLAAASAKLPASLGGKTSAASLSIVQATDNAFKADLSANTYVVDVASAALTATATTAAVTPGAGTVSQEFVVSVTAVSGTGPTLDVAVQESSDDGTNWFDIYHFPRITAAGHYRSPSILQQGTRTRFVQTVGGTTPSFTRSLGRVRSNKVTTYIRSFIDRAIAPNTLNSTTASFDVEGCSRVQLMIRMAAITTTAPAFKLQGSNDNSNWYDIGTAVTAVANAIVTIQADAILPSNIRAIVSTAGVGAALGELWFKVSRS